MSIEALNWAIRAAAPDPSSKLILILLANYANHDGQAWPSLTTLATQSGLDRRTVMRKIGELIDAKLIEKTVNRDRKSTRLNSSHANISYAVFCLKKKKK